MRISAAISVFPVVFFLLAGLFVPAPLQAGGVWRVIPIRLDFDQKTKSGVVTLHNDGDTPLNLQMQATVWSQDAEGKDVYQPSEDLVFFPRIMTVPPKENRVVRAGIRVPAVSVEKTYRLFIEELPEAKKEAGTAVAIALRFGVPVFAAPLQPQMRGEINGAVVIGGQLQAEVRNAGNVHFRIRSLRIVGRDAAGIEVLQQKADGWYLLAGAVRRYAVPLPDDGCRKVAELELLADTDKGTFTTRLKGDPAACSP